MQALRLALIVMPTDSSSLWNDQPLLEVSEDAWVGPECRNRCRWLALMMSLVGLNDIRCWTRL